MEKKTTHPQRKVSVNKGTLIEAALYAGPEKIEPIYSEVCRTLERLEVDPSGAKPFGGVRRTEGGRPSIHDVVYWLDDLKNERKYTRDIRFLKRLYATLKERVYTPPVNK